MKKKVVIALPTQSTYYLCLKRAFDFLGWEYFFFDYREFTLFEKAVTTIFNDRPRSIQLLNNRLQKFIDHINPSWLFVIKGETILPQTLEVARKRGLKTVNWFPDGLWLKEHLLNVVNDYEFFIHFDSLASEYLKKKGHKNVSHLSYAADLLPSDPDPVYGSSRKFPVSFVGNYFSPRENLFSNVPKSSLYLWGDKPWTTSKLAESYQGVCPFGKVDEILSKTKISINLHYAKKSNGANLRVFESARAGACLLTDWKSDMANLYVPGEEIMIYNNSDDFKHKIRDLLGNPGLTQKLGMRSFQKTKREHTYVHRIKAILDTIR